MNSRRYGAISGDSTGPEAVREVCLTAQRGRPVLGAPYLYICKSIVFFILTVAYVKALLIYVSS